MTGLGLCYVYCILTVFSTHKHNQNIFYSNNQGGGREEGSNPFFLGSESFVDPINPKGRFLCWEKSLSTQISSTQLGYMLANFRRYPEYPKLFRIIPSGYYPKWVLEICVLSY